MTDVVVATLAAAVRMGQQEYEEQLVAHLPSAAPDLSVRHVRVRSLRSKLPGEARLPLAMAGRSQGWRARAFSRAAYGSSRIVHRCDLRLPPAPNEVVTVHDLAPLRFDDEGVLPEEGLSSIGRARAVIVPSAFAGSELRALTGRDDAIVIHNGLDPALFAPVAPVRPPSERFVLHSGGATSRKNLAALAAAWRIISTDLTDVDLVLCGPEDNRRTSLFAGLPRVHLLGRVQRGLHLGLIQAAKVVVVPSVYEGFGFPALEAMALGTAVVASNTSSLPEVCGAAAHLVDPTGDGLAQGLIHGLTDESLRQRLAVAGKYQVQGFTWERNAEQHAMAYRSLLSRM